MAFTPTPETAEKLAKAKQEAEAEEREALRTALQNANGSIAAVCRQSGVPRATLDRRIAKLGLQTWLRETYPLGLRQPRRKKNEPEPPMTECVPDNPDTPSDSPEKD